MGKKQKGWTEAEVIAVCATRHRQRQWAFVPQVRSTGGHPMGGVNYLDAVAISCWPSSAFRLIVYEAKCSRADWLAELERPDKRQFAERIGNECWFACPAGVAKEAELPQGWGLLEVSRRCARRIVAAPYRRFSADGEAEVLPAFFVAMVCRALIERIPKPLRPVYVLNGKSANMVEVREHMQGLAREEIDRLTEDAREEVWRAERESQKPTKELAEAVKAAMGQWKVPTVEEFASWVAKGAVSGQLEGAMQSIYNLAHHALNRTLGKLPG